MSDLEYCLSLCSFSLWGQFPFTRFIHRIFSSFYPLHCGSLLPPPLLLSIFIRLPSFLLLHWDYLPRGHPQSADYDAGEVSRSSVLWLNLACMNHACGQRSRSEMMARVNVQHSPGPVTSYADFLFLRLCVFDFVSHEWTSTRVRLHIAAICLTVEEHGVHVIGLFLYIMNRQCTVTVSYRETLIPLWVCMNQREYSIYKKNLPVYFLSSWIIVCLLPFLFCYVVFDTDLFIQFWTSVCWTTEMVFPDD